MPGTSRLNLDSDKTPRELLCWKRTRMNGMMLTLQRSQMNRSTQPRKISFKKTQALKLFRPLGTRFKRRFGLFDNWTLSWPKMRMISTLGWLSRRLP